MTGTRPSSSGPSVRRRATIVDAARHLLREYEVDGISVSDVAAAAGVSTATVYNLVGTRDRLLLAVLDETVAEVERLADPSLPGIDGCLSIFVAGGEVVLSDPVAHRRALGALGAMAPDLWLDTGLAELLGRWADGALADGTLTGRPATDTLVDLLQYGYRGVLISWVFGLVHDDDLPTLITRQALHVLSDAVPEDHRPALLERLDRLDQPSGSTERIPA